MRGYVCANGINCRMVMAPRLGGEGGEGGEGTHSCDSDAAYEVNSALLQSGLNRLCNKF